MKRLSNTFIPALLLCLLPMVLAAQDTPPILDCTEPDGVDAKLVATTQRASAKHLGEKPTLEIIDTHVHFYDPTRPQGIPWPGKNNKQLYRPVLPDEFKRLSKPFGVAGTIVVEASPWIEDNQWCLDLAAKEPVWNNEFDIELGSISDDIMLSVKDKEMMGSKLIGSANVKASAFCINNGVRDWFTFDFDGKSIG